MGEKSPIFTAKKLKRYKEAFQEMDKYEDGFISLLHVRNFFGIENCNCYCNYTKQFEEIVDKIPKFINLMGFIESSKMEKDLEMDEIKDLIIQFDELDKNQIGLIPKGDNYSEVKETFIDFEGFLQANLSAEKINFKEIDRNGDGKISNDELVQFLKGKGMKFKSKKELATVTNSMIKKIDQNGDGQISFKEYFEYFDFVTEIN